MGRWVLIIVVSLSGVFTAASQEPIDTIDVDTYIEQLEIDFPTETPKQSEIKSPTLALTLSAIVPGAGQIYNGSYWKVPIIFGFAGYFTYAIVILHDYYTDYRQQFRDSLLDDTVTDARRNELRFIRDWYRDQRDRFAWYMGFLYIINLLDAYVEATLTGFDVGEDLTLRIMPYFGYNIRAGLQMQLNF